MAVGRDGARIPMNKQKKKRKKQAGLLAERDTARQELSTTSMIPAL